MFHRIIVPTDFSSCSEEAWRLAQRLAGMSGAELVLTHVLSEASLFREGPFIMPKVREVFEAAIGTHGRGGVDRALLGSVADRVIRLAPCPVLSVREPD
jgi:nucleotide-binding universal stress UspA family protein